MRYPEALSKTLSQNNTLRLVSVFMTLAVIMLSTLCIGLSDKTPVFIERSCVTKVIEGSEEMKKSKTEVEEFIKKAISQRFNTHFEKGYKLLSFQESEKQKKELSHLAAQKMKQTIIVNNIKSEEGYFLVDTDRLISVGKIRSGFIFPLKVKLIKVTRSLENPYGLIVHEISILKEDLGGQ